jgi:probable HAF family extracellular repeat protein
MTGTSSRRSALYVDGYVGEDFLFTDTDGVQPLFVYPMKFTGFNNSRQACGWRNMPTPLDGTSYAFRFSPDVGADYFTTRASIAYDINEGGDVTGWIRSGSGSRAFLYSGAGSLVELPTLGGPTATGRGINADRYIVGSSSTSSKAGAPSKPFIYHASFGTIDLTKQIDTTALPSGTTFGGTHGITDARVILIDTNTVGPCLWCRCRSSGSTCLLALIHWRPIHILLLQTGSLSMIRSQWFVIPATAALSLVLSIAIQTPQASGKGSGGGGGGTSNPVQYQLVMLDGAGSPLAGTTAWVSDMNNDGDVVGSRHRRLAVGIVWSMTAAAARCTT